MTPATEPFDQHPHIAYSDITHLFWGIYPYKIVIPYRLGTMKTYWSKEFRQEMTNREENAIIFPGEETIYYQNRSRQITCFFFENSLDAMKFITDNKNIISEVCRPRSNAMVDKLSDPKIRVRNNLFHGIYRWKMQFKVTEQNGEEIQKLDEWTANNSDVDHRYITNKKSRTIYMNSEHDLVMLKLTFADTMNSITTCVLHNELPNHKIVELNSGKNQIAY